MVCLRVPSASRSADLSSLTSVKTLGTEWDFSIFVSFLLSQVGVAEWFTTLSCVWHARLWVWIPTNACGYMICKYMDWKGLVAIMTSVQSVSVVIEVNLRITTGEKAWKQGIHPGFNTLGRCHQKSKTEVSVAPQKGPVSTKNFEKVSYCSLNYGYQSQQ